MEDDKGQDTVGINPALLQSMIDDLERKTHALQETGNSLRRKLNYGSNLSHMQNILLIGQWAQDQLPLLKRIYNLAVELDKDPGQRGIVEIPGHLIMSAQADQRKAYADGARLADQIKDKIGHDGHMIPPEVMDELAKHKNDPAFTAGFFSWIGPEKAAQFPSWVMDVQYNTNAQIVLQGHINKPEDVERWLGTWATSLAAATRYLGDDALSKDYGKKMAESNPWGTSQILRFDENGKQLVFGREFLVSAGESLIPRMEHLKKNDVSRTKLAAKVGGGDVTLKLGASDADKYQDFMVGYLEALGANHDAAQDIALHRNNKGEYDYLKILAQDVSNPLTAYWDKGDTLGKFFEAASTEVRNTDEDGRRSAESASAIIDVLAKGGGGKAAIPEAAHDSVGNIISSYIGDVEKAANDKVPLVGNNASQVLDLNTDDPYFRARFNKDNIRAVAGQAMMEEGARTTILNAAASHSAAILVYDAQTRRWGEGLEAIEHSLGNVYGLHGLLAQGWNEADIKKSIAEDKKSAALAKSLSDVVGFIPLPKTVTEQAGQVMTDILKKGIENVRTQTIDQAVKRDKTSPAINEANIRNETFLTTADLLALSVAHEYGLFPPGEDPVEWAKNNPGKIQEEEQFWNSDGNILPYGEIQNSLRGNGINEYLNGSKGGREFSDMSRNQMSQYLSQFNRVQKTGG